MLLIVESAFWLVFGVLAAVGAALLLQGGHGLDGIAYSGDTGGEAHTFGAFVMPLAVVMILVAAGGIWAGATVKQLTRGRRAGAILICVLGLIIGVLYLVFNPNRVAGASLGIPLIVMNTLIIYGLAVAGFSRV